MPYIYEGHMGSLYVTDEYQEYEVLYCEQCGDSDSLLGHANNKKEAWELLKSETDINGSGGWGYDYIQELINTSFED